MPGPETDLFAEACKESKVYGVFSIMEKILMVESHNTAVIDPQGEMILKYRG